MRSFRIAALIVLMAGAHLAQAGDARPAPNYSKDIAPILFQNCVTCHRPGEAAPFSLLTFDDAAKRGKLIAKVTQSRLMPPWKAEKGDVDFRNERRLKPEQIALLDAWVKAGMPEGNKADMPPAPVFADGWTLGKPDLVVKMPKAYRVRADGPDIYRNFSIALGLKEDKWVKAIDFRPSAQSAVHHTLFFLDTSGASSKRELASGEVGFRGAMGGFTGGKGKGGLGGGLGGILSGLSGEGGATAGGIAGLGGWALGAQPRFLPTGLAFHIPKGSDLILSTHFHPSGKAEDEASTVAIYFADKAPTQRFTGVQLPFGFGIMAGIDIPAGAKDFAIEDSFVLPVDARTFGVSAHAHYLAKDFNVTATLPDGKKKTLLHIADWDFAWQEQYQFKDFVDLPKGTKLHARITYDNSAENPHNPTSPPKRVRWGKDSTDEMGSITLQVVAANEAEFSRLQSGYQRHIADSALRGAMKKFKK